MSRRIAVLVSNGQFQDPKLPSVRSAYQDSAGMGAILGDPEIGRFEVLQFVDDRFFPVRRAIAYACSQQTDEDDLMLFYYSGPSLMYWDGTLCLPLYDTEADLLPATSIEAEFVLSQFRRSRGQKVLLVDGCHSGAFFENNRGIPDDLFAITACSRTEMCTETELGSVFTHAIIEGLSGARADRDNDGKVSGDELYEFIQEHVRKGGYSFHPQKWVWNVQKPLFLSSVPRPVFISYAREDGQLARELAAELETRSIPAWLDTAGISGGQDWKEKIAATLQSARALILVMSEAALASVWVRRELEFADQIGLPIVPVASSTCDSPAWFKLQFGMLQWHQLVRPRFRESIDTLVEAIRTIRKRDQA